MARGVYSYKMDQKELKIVFLIQKYFFCENLVAEQTLMEEIIWNEVSLGTF